MAQPMANSERQDIQFKLAPYHRGVSDTELLADVQRVAAELGKESITSREYCKFGRFGGKTIFVRLGSWNQVLPKAGLRPSLQTNISDKELFENLEQVWISLGRQPGRREIIRPRSLYSWRPYTRRFGTWRNALVAFVEFVNSSSDADMATNELGVAMPGKRTKRDPSLRLRFLVMRRDDFKCKHCGRSPSGVPGLVLHVDHIVPWTKGGETEEDNLQTLCVDCNQGKGNLLENT
jgi:hypothetical protein